MRKNICVNNLDTIRYFFCFEPSLLKNSNPTTFHSDPQSCLLINTSSRNLCLHLSLYRLSVFGCRDGHFYPGLLKENGHVNFFFFILDLISFIEVSCWGAVERPQPSHQSWKHKKERSCQVGWLVVPVVVPVSTSTFKLKILVYRTCKYKFKSIHRIILQYNTKTISNSNSTSILVDHHEIQSCRCRSFIFVVVVPSRTTTATSFCFFVVVGHEE